MNKSISKQANGATSTGFSSLKSVSFDFTFIAQFNMETIKLIYQDNRSEEDSCAVYYFQKYIYCLILKDGQITSII